MSAKPFENHLVQVNCRLFDSHRLHCFGPSPWPLAHLRTATACTTPDRSHEDLGRFVIDPIKDCVRCALHQQPPQARLLNIIARSSDTRHPRDVADKCAECFLESRSGGRPVRSRPFLQLTHLSLSLGRDADAKAHSSLMNSSMRFPEHAFRCLLVPITRAPVSRDYP